MSKKYISVDSENNKTQDCIKMENEENEVTAGQIRTKDSSDTFKDIKEIFIQKSDFDEIDPIDEKEPAEYTLKEMASKYNELLNALKGAISIVVAMLCLGAFADDPAGKAKLYNIKASQYVVTNEVDSVFTEWKSDGFNTFTNDLNGWKSDVSSWQTSIDNWISGDFTNFYNDVINWKSDVENWKADVEDWRTNDVFIVTNKTEVHFGVENPTNDFYINDRSLGEIIKQTIPSEKDPQFESEFKNVRTSIGAGYGTLVDSKWSGWKSVAIGIPGAYTSNYYGNNDDFVFNQNPNINNRYRYDFMGPAVAFRDSVALGSAAQARSQVAIAIGVGAIVANLHGLDGTNTIGYVQDTKTITTTYDASDNIVNVTTNMGVITNFVDVAVYESLPYGRGTFPSVANYVTTNIVEGGKIVKATYLENMSTGAIDPSFATEDEMQMYDFPFSSGQNGINYKDGIYGIAIGYRSMAVAFHTLALGHYARAYRPHSVAVGPSSHIKSEGSVGLGYINTIETNSPFCLAVGSNTSIDSGMTNAIVIGVPPVDFSRRFSDGYKDSGSPYVYQRGVAKAMKSNSINFVFNGEGLKDVFVDCVPMTDRMSYEIDVLGSMRSAMPKDEIKSRIDEITGTLSGDKSIRFVSGGGIKIFTENYLDELEEWDANLHEHGAKPRTYGDVSQVEINGKPLSEIIGSSGGEDARFEAYHTTVTNAAAQALIEVNNATNFNDVKNALTNFFNSISK